MTNGRGYTHLLKALGAVAAEEFGGLVEVAGPAAPLGHDEGESCADDATTNETAEDPAIRSGFGCFGTPVRKHTGEVTVGGEERRRQVSADAGFPGRLGVAPFRARRLVTRKRTSFAAAASCRSAG
ncbi:hypothetical protein [Streptomyces sp. NPDC053069]|uniref:hypothetical protein n=1 Tax=Streptomyces sp. NPDC053069 TaxID=3365695 RepID=UPI0037CD5C12